MFLLQGVIEDMCLICQESEGIGHTQLGNLELTAGLSGPVRVPVNMYSLDSAYVVLDWHIISSDFSLVNTLAPPIRTLADFFHEKHRCLTIVQMSY